MGEATYVSTKPLEEFEINRKKRNDLIHKQDVIEALGIIADKMTVDGQTVMEQAIEIVRDLQPVQKTGRWVLWTYGDSYGNNWELLRCSECKMHVNFESDYCPHCGAHMKGE